MSNAQRRMLVIGIVIALCIAASSAFLASSHPDGLERVAEDLGFLKSAQGPHFRLLPDYTVPGLGDGPLSKIVAGGIGVLVVTTLVIGAGALLRRRS